MTAVTPDIQEHTEIQNHTKQHAQPHRITQDHVATLMKLMNTQRQPETAQRHGWRHLRLSDAPETKRRSDGKDQSIPASQPRLQAQRGHTNIDAFPNIEATFVICK